MCWWRLCGHSLRLYASAGVLLPEALDTTGRIDNFLLAGIEGMADRAHLNRQIVPKGRLGLEGVPAATRHIDDAVIGVNACFHGSSFRVRRRFVRQPDREPRIIHGCRVNIKTASGQSLNKPAGGCRRGSTDQSCIAQLLSAHFG